MKYFSFLIICLFLLFCVNAFAADTLPEKLQLLAVIGVPLVILVGAIFYLTDTRRPKK